MMKVSVQRNRLDDVVLLDAHVVLSLPSLIPLCRIRRSTQSDGQLTCLRAAGDGESVTQSDEDSESGMDSRSRWDLKGIGLKPCP